MKHASKEIKRLRGIRMLMFASQFLLLCFMVYWLRTEYVGEKDVLKKDLTVQFEHAQQAIVDSVLMVTVVSPALNGMPRGQVKITGRIDVDDSFHSVIRDSPVLHPTIKIGASSSSSVEKKVIYFRNDHPESMLAHGVRLMLQNSHGLPRDIGRHLLFSDTGSLVKDFRKTVDKSGKHLSFNWVSSAPDSSKRRLLLLSAGTPGYSLEVGAYNTYLFKRMMPQFIITLLLLSLTAIAFRITYRSLKAQMHLAAIRNEFISNMSHELKTPVSTVKVALEAIAEPEVLADKAKTTDYLQMATLEMNRLEMLINLTLQSSLLENGNSAMQQEAVDMRSLVEEMLRVMQPRFDQLNAQVSIESSGNHFVVPVDRLQVQGVIINILDNALKYAGPSPKIDIRILGENGNVKVAIEDNGPGIPPQYASRIFEKFFRVPHGNEHTVKGYGLGLSYAAQIMKRHGGSITMRPVPTGGCIFLLEFKGAQA